MSDHQRRPTGQEDNMPHPDDMREDLRLLELVRNGIAERQTRLRKFLVDAMDNANTGIARKAIAEVEDHINGELDKVMSDSINAVAARFEVDLDDLAPRERPERQNVDQVSMAGARL